MTMTRTTFDVDKLREVLDSVVAQDPDHVDRRPAGKLPPRYLDCGKPACLVGVILARLGVSRGLLRELDKEGSPLWASRHPIRKRFTPEAWALLSYLQSWNDGRRPWGLVRRDAFRADPYWTSPGPWCTADNAIAKEE